MRSTITRRLFIALLVISLALLVMSALFGRLSFQQGFNAYLAAREAPVIEQLAEALARDYSTKIGWGLLRSNERLWLQYFRQLDSAGPSGRRGGPPGFGPRGRNGPKGKGGTSGPPSRDGRLPPPNAPGFLPERVGLFDLNGEHIAGQRLTASNLTNSAEYSTTAVVANGQEIAELRVLPPPAPSNSIDIAFDEAQKTSLAGIAALLLVIAWAASWLLARQFTKPIRQLADGTRALASGDYNQPIAVNTNDELGALASDVNTLARVLETNRESRRRWLGDINHELRTPITVLTAELQALEDGYRPFDANSVASLQSEVDRLAALVDDLYSLSSSDEGQLEYRFTNFDFRNLLTDRIESVDGRLKENGLTLTTQLPTSPTLLNADETRIGQLVTNLIENSIRHTNSPGKIDIALSARTDSVEFSICDSEPGVAVELHKRIFERLYRVDPSRNRAKGGSGLGLSICKAIVEAHSGTIIATSANQGGLRIDVCLPLSQAHLKGSSA